MRWTWRKCLGPAWGPVVLGVCGILLTYALAGCTPMNTYPTEASVQKRMEVASDEFKAGVDKLSGDHKLIAEAVAPDAVPLIDANMDAFREAVMVLSARMDSITEGSVASANSTLDQIFGPALGASGMGGLWALLTGQRRKKEGDEEKTKREGIDTKVAAVVSEVNTAIAAVAAGLNEVKHTLAVNSPAPSIPVSVAGPTSVAPIKPA